MENKTILVYNWFDIQKEICKEMNIEEKYFRDYHKLIGGEYKDLWHEYMNYFENRINNDTIVDSSLGEMIEYKIKWVKEDNKEWLVPFIEAVYKVFDKFDISYVEYSW